VRVVFLVAPAGGGDAEAEAAGGHARELARRGVEAEVRGAADGPVTRRPGDVVVAVWARAAAGAAHDVLLLRCMEDRLGVPGAAAEHTRAGAVIASEGWIIEQLDALRAGRIEGPVLLVREGVDKDVFAAPPAVRPALDGPLRIAAAGGGRTAAQATAEQMREPHAFDYVAGGAGAAERAAAFRGADVVLVTAPVTGDARASLEGFHCGATCVTTPVTGHEEHVVDGVNGLVASFDDDRGTARLLDLLARDRRLLHELRTAALATARAWPSPARSAAMLALALRRIASAPTIAGDA
jgi:glycosyltransferase involved in cell wall biosynthesis